MAKREPPADLLGALLDSLIEAKQVRERRKEDQENRRSPSDKERGARRSRADKAGNALTAALTSHM